jgi:endonuclease V-like protein UPF0215 family
MGRGLSNVVGFDDAPFPRSHRGNVRVVGTIFAGSRLEGVLSGWVRRDGANATRVLVRMIGTSRYAEQLQLILLQGIALAGFNVIDVPRLHRETGLPVVVVARHRPDLAAIEQALRNRIPGGLRKWRLIEALGPMRPAAGVWLQPAGISLKQAAAAIDRLAVHGKLPEPLRSAHIIAGGIATGESRHRA